MTTFQTLSHTEVLQCPADAIWQAFQQAGSILCNGIPEYFANCEYVEGHGDPGSIRIITLGPRMKAMSSTGFLKERIDKLDYANRTLKYTILEGGDPEYSHYDAEFIFKGLVGETTEATWTASFEPVNIDKGPPSHLKLIATKVFKIFEGVAQAMKTFTHSEKLEGSPDAIWKACRHIIENPPSKVIPKDNSTAMSANDSVVVGNGDECDKPGCISEMKMVDPAISYLGDSVAWHMERVDDSTKKLTYSPVKGIPDYMYFSATEEFTSGPEEGTTTATWVATYSPARGMGAPEHIKNNVVSNWKGLEMAVKVNPKMYVGRN